jgi:hypothetical protein
VAALFGEGLLKAEVVARLNADACLGDGVRRAAVALAERTPDDPWALNDRARKLATEPGRSAADYALALRLVETACAAGPEDPAVLGTLGVAQYRTGQHPAAVATLRRCLELYGPAYDWDVTELAFLALAHQRLGQTEPAAAHAERVRARLKDLQGPADGRQRDLLKEIDALGIGTARP